MTDDSGRPPHIVRDERDYFAMVYEAAFAKWRVPGSKLTPVAMMVYIALIFRADRVSRDCYPSVDVIAAEAACSRRAAIDALAILEKEGLISITPRYTNAKRQTSNTYTIKHITMQNLHSDQDLRGAKSAPSEGAKSAPSGVQNLHPNYIQSNQRETDISADAEKTEIAKAKPDYTQAFETFWKAYPSGGGIKKQTFDAWKRLKPDAATQAAMIAGLERWKRSKRWREGYVKSAHIWIRDRWWENEPPEMAPAPGSNGSTPRPLKIIEPLEEGEGNPMDAILKAMGEK